jgi:CheY-like chemotaxis protein
VQDVCRACLLFVREQAFKKRLRLDLQLNDQDAVIAADLTRLKQILVNLLSNAVKFTPEGGAVSLEVTVDMEEGVARFSVHDTGIGIAPTDLGRLFQPFSQIDSPLSRESEGTGLGLALVRRMTEVHGGSVTVESTPGQGSRFTVALPYHSAAGSTAADAASAGVHPAATLLAIPVAAMREPILLADDNETNIRLLQEYLRARGYAVTVARDGYEALALVNQVQPRLILMDIQMPRLDGLAAIRRLRALPAYSATPIIALTALAMPGDRERCLGAGATAYLAKPVSLRTLVQIIEQLLDG